MPTGDWRLSRTFDFNGKTIAWDAIGDGPPAVVMHGTPFSSVEWRRIAPWLARHRRVYYYDMLGYGRSAKPDADVSRGIQNKLFAALLDHWRLDAPDIVAHDFGGSTALRTYILDGKRYRSLVLIDPVAISPQGSPLVKAAQENEKVFAGLPAYVHRAILAAYLGTAVGNELRADDLKLYMEPWLGEEGQKAFWRQIAQMSDKYSEEVEHRYGEINCPVTVVWGAEDEWIAVEQGQELARRLSNAPFQTVPRAKHLVQEDAPEALVSIVLDFWTGLDRA